MDEGKTSGGCHSLRFANVLLLVARRLQMSNSFARLCALGLLGVWLSIFAGNASAYCTVEDFTPPRTICTAPTVSITSPANGATYTLPTSFPVTATVDNAGQSITQVDFYVNGTVFQTVTTAPYSVTYTPPAPGTYTFRATATETRSGTRTGSSSLVSVNVVSPTNAPPSVSITALQQRDLHSPSQSLPERERLG